MTCHIQILRNSGVIRNIDSVDVLLVFHIGSLALSYSLIGFCHGLSHCVETGVSLGLHVR
jgi:hypothetical protein